MKKGIWIFISAMIIAGGVLVGVLLLRSHTAPTPPMQQLDGWVSIEGKRVAVVVADTDVEREQGLSGHVPLAENEGMLFLFDVPGRPAFWMKDMLFSLDIIWLSSDWKIVDITPNLTPDTYPASFAPLMDAQYVLEVSAGFAAREGVQIGQSVVFEK
jgi:uncharacterized membrane protein (UPF0127 family)